MDDVSPRGGGGDGYVRSDTPDPRASSTTILPQVDISAAWRFTGTNNSGLRASPIVSPVCHTIPTEFTWSPIAMHSQSMQNGGFLSGYGRLKRHWENTDVRFDRDDPPCKVHVNEEKVAQQFHSMSLNAANSCSTRQNETASDSSNNSSQCSSVTVDAMWRRFHELENKLDTSHSDTEVDEGVDMDGDSESTDQSDTSIQTLHITPSLQAKISNSVLPQILVPKPCKEVVLWQPSGVDFLKDVVKPEVMAARAQLTVQDCGKARRRKKTATRSLSPNSSLMLPVPSVRANSPPPNNKAEPVSSDIPVCFVDDSNDSQMDV